MPPGTGDIALSLSQYLPKGEVYVVTTPQQAAQKVARLSAAMATKVGLPVKGVIENMSWFTGDDGKKYELFGSGGGQELADELNLARIHVVGHSWGGAVALRLAAAAPRLVATACLIDGGLTTPSAPSGSDPDRRAELLARLRPPALGIPIDDIWQIIGEGMGGSLTLEMRAALAPTYEIGADGLARTVIGIDRHMAVLEGLLDYDPWPDADSLLVPLWAVFCEPRHAQADEVRRRVIERTQHLPTALVQRWNGALHDVPLQWPALVAGLVDSLVESSAGDLARCG
jgi:pimeloyl-ACP methyl ester carboxylesterase